MGKNFSLNSNKNRPKSDFYQTPYSLTELLLKSESFSGNVLEPACGDGAIVKVLNDFGFETISYDIETNFLNETKTYDNIITNPPYSLAKEFILKAFEVSKSKIAMLLPLNYLHGIERFQSIYSLKKLETVYVFTRYPLLEQTIRSDGKFKTGMMVYAWYIWNLSFSGYPTIKWLNNNNFVIKNSGKL